MTIAIINIWFIEWYEGYKNVKFKKQKIKEELMSIFLDPSRWWDCCISKDEKKRDRKIVGINIDWMQKLFWPKRTTNKDVLFVECL